MQRQLCGYHGIEEFDCIGAVSHNAVIFLTAINFVPDA